MTDSPSETIAPLSRFASLTGLLAAAFYFTGWIYRLVYFSNFQIDLISLELPPESFLFVPIQVFFGSVFAIARTIFILVVLLVFPNFVRRSLRQLRRQLHVNPAVLGYFNLSLLKEITIVAVVFCLLFFSAFAQGNEDARRDIDPTRSTLPPVTFLTPDESAPLGRNPTDPTVLPRSLGEFRFFGNLDAIAALERIESNEARDRRSWRLLLRNGGWIYLTYTLDAENPRARPFTVAVQEASIGHWLILGGKAERPNEKAQ